MVNIPDAFIVLPMALYYGLMILRLISWYFTRAFRSDRDNQFYQRPLLYYVIPASTELALATIAIDLAILFVGGPAAVTGMSSAAPDPRIYLMACLVLIFFHIQIYLFATLAEQRLRAAESSGYPRGGPMLVSMFLGLLAIMTNVVTIGRLVFPRGF